MKTEKSALRIQKGEMKNGGSERWWESQAVKGVVGGSVVFFLALLCIEGMCKTSR